MIKFEEHKGQLFRMLEEPTPLTPDAEMPCIVRLIQDDSPTGRYNRYAAYFDVIGKLWVAQKIKENPYYSNTLHAYYKDSNGQDSCIASIHELEIIGYPVDEGSAEWALYQMMQGKKVIHKHTIGNVCCALNQDGNVQYYHMDNLAYIGKIRSKLEFVKKNVAKTGWQLYKEPKPETLFDTWQCPVCGESISAEFEDSGHPRYNEEHLDENLCFAIGDHMKYSHTVEQPKYKVGDWVEWCGDQYMVKSAPPQSGGRYNIRSPYEELGWSVYPKNITRKLSPSEIIVKIGCLSGTIGKSCEPACFLMWHSNPKMDFNYSIIRFSALDTQTRELVESLLKAQEEEK